VFGGQFQLPCVPQEVGEVIVKLGVVRKRLQSSSANQKLQLDMRAPFTVYGKATFTNIPHLNALGKYLEEDFNIFPT
jgi:hypothetical protein